MISRVLCSLTLNPLQAPLLSLISHVDLLWARFIFYLTYIILFKFEANLKIGKFQGKTFVSLKSLEDLATLGLHSPNGWLEIRGGSSLFLHSPHYSQLSH